MLPSESSGGNESVFGLSSQTFCIQILALLLTSSVIFEPLTVESSAIPLKVISLFSLAVFKIFSLSLLLNSFIMMCLDVGFFMFIVHGAH